MYCAELREKAMRSGGIFVLSGGRGSRQICMNAFVRLFEVYTGGSARGYDLLCSTNIRSVFK
jgi:hypothetical protein